MIEAAIETARMTFAALAISWAFALPLAIAACETGPGGLFRNRIAHAILDAAIGIGRSVPFVILAALMFPLTRAIVGTSIGTRAAIIPLAAAAIPLEARLAETELSACDRESIEAAMADGASRLRISLSIRLASRIPHVANAVGVSAVSIAGCSSMAGIVGGGGLGAYAITRGFQRFDWPTVAACAAILAGFAIAIQAANAAAFSILKRSILCETHR